MNVKEIQRLIKNNKDQITFLLGNGINRYYNIDNLTWSQLLLDIWNLNNDNKRKDVPLGIHITEFYDAVELTLKEETSYFLVQKQVKKLIKDWQPSNRPNYLLDRIYDLNTPIITTNFDDLMAKYLGLNQYNITTKDFTDFYPWKTYFSKTLIKNNLREFAIWHLNGMMKYHRSIKLGLSHYIGNTERARRLMHKRPDNIYFQGKNNYDWLGKDTWLNILLNKTIIIIGLGLDEVEIFIRWLLIERKKYFKKFPERAFSAYYIALSSELSEGKTFFLESVGVKPIVLNSYEEIYEGLWKF